MPAALAEDARATGTASSAADGLVSIGGGSAVGLAKAVALSDGLPIAAVPTTYAGSELTVVWGMTEEGRKTTGRDPSRRAAPRRLRPRAHLRPAPRRDCRERDERRRALRRGVLGAGRDAGHRQRGGGGAAPARDRHPCLAARSARPVRARHGARGGLARRRGVRRRRRAAPQALPRARRHVRPAARRAARRPAAVHGGLPPAGGARGGSAHRGGAGGRRSRRRRSARWPATSARPVRLPRSG